MRTALGCPVFCVERFRTQPRCLATGCTNFRVIRPLIDWLDYNGYTVVSKPAKEFDDGEGSRCSTAFVHRTSQPILRDAPK